MGADFAATFEDFNPHPHVEGDFGTLTEVASTESFQSTPSRRG